MRSLLAFPTIAIIFFVPSILALYVPTLTSLTNAGSLYIPVNENSSVPYLPTANVSVSAPAFKSNLTLDFLGQNGLTDGLKPVCNSRFGTNLNIQSCCNALRAIGDGTNPVSFGDRGKKIDYQLPHRISSPDGTCVVDIFHKDGTTLDYSTFREISTAASLTVFGCVRQSSGYSGGYIRDVGVSKNLVIVVSAYEPAVTCYGSVGRALAVTQNLIDIIPTTYDYETFGSAEVPDVQNVLPKKYRQSFRGFYAEFSTTIPSRAVVSRWFDLWAATVAINVMCVRWGNAGGAVVNGGLVVKLDRTYVPPFDGSIVSGSFNGSSAVDVA